MKFYRKFYEWRAYVDLLMHSTRDQMTFAWYTRQRISPILQASHGDALDKPQADNLILDVGCGEGTFSFYLASLGNVVGIDISLVRIKEAVSRSKKGLERRTEFIVGDAEKLPFRKKLFDIIICAELLEHVLHPNKLLDEMIRATKDQGKILIEIPNANITFSKLLGFPLILSRKIMRVAYLENNKHDDIMGEDIKFLPKKYFEVKKEFPKGFREHLRSFTPTSLEVLLKDRNIKCIRFLKTEPLSLALYEFCARFPKIIPLINGLNKILKYIPRIDRHSDLILVCVSNARYE